MLAGLRLLIVEDEFLIALDMQRALEAAGAREAMVARTLDEAAALGDAIAGFDLVILPPPPPEAEHHRLLLQRIAAAGSAIVVCSGFRGSRADVPDAEFVDKPFADDELVAACERALARRKPR